MFLIAEAYRLEVVGSFVWRQVDDLPPQVGLTLELRRHWEWNFVKIFSHHVRADEDGENSGEE